MAEIGGNWDALFFHESGNWDALFFHESENTMEEYGRCIFSQMWKHKMIIKLCKENDILIFYKFWEEYII